MYPNYAFEGKGITRWEAHICKNIPNHSGGFTIKCQAFSMKMKADC